MRMMLTVSIPVEVGNTTVKNGRLPQIMQDTMARLKPEAAYFLAKDGKRTALFFFDLADVSNIPSIVEPLFMGMDAAVAIVPVMNAEDLQKGLVEAAKNF